MERTVKNIPMILMVTYFLKGLFLGFDLVGLGVISVIGGLCALSTYLDKHSDIQSVKAIVNEQNKVIEKIARELVELKSSVVGAKLQQGFSTQGIRKSS